MEEQCTHWVKRFVLLKDQRNSRPLYFYIDTVLSVSYCGTYFLNQYLSEPSATCYGYDVHQLLTTNSKSYYITLAESDQLITKYTHPELFI